MDLGYRIQPDDIDATGRPVDPIHIGMYNMAMAPSTISEAEIDTTKGTLRTTATFREDWTWNQQLSAMDWSTEGISAPTLHHLVYQGWRPGAVTRRARWTPIGDRVDLTRLPAEETAASLVSLPARVARAGKPLRLPFDRGSAELADIRAPWAAGTDASRSRYAGADPGGHDGYVVCPVLSDDGLRVDVFDAGEVGRGPLASISANGATVPVLLHAAWAPRAVTAPDHERLRFGDDIRDEDLGCAAVRPARRRRGDRQV